MKYVLATVAFATWGITGLIAETTPDAKPATAGGTAVSTAPKLSIGDPAPAMKVAKWVNQTMELSLAKAAVDGSYPAGSVNYLKNRLQSFKTAQHKAGAEKQQP